MPSLRVTAVLAVLAGSWSFALADGRRNPMVTAAAQLMPRATDPEFVGYISANGGYSDSRSCSYPETISTSGNYVQCCPTTGACPFFTSCSDNTLIAASATVSCDFDPALTCNTGLVFTTTSQQGGGNSYLACWQTSLGSSPFTIVQNIGSATAAAGSSSAMSTSGSNSAQSSSSGSGSGSRSSSGSGSASAFNFNSGSSTASSASSTSSSATKNAAIVAGGEAGLNGGILGGALALIAQLVL